MSLIFIFSGLILDGEVEVILPDVLKLPKMVKGEFIGEISLFTGIFEVGCPYLLGIYFRIIYSTSYFLQLDYEMQISWLPRTVFWQVI